jgi:hypothetical protein
LVRKELSDRLRERREALSKLAPVPGLDGAARFRGQSASVVGGGKTLKLHGCRLASVVVEPLVLGFEIVVKVRAQVGDDLVVDASSWLGRLSRQEIMVDLVVVSSQAEMEMA